MNVNTTLSKPLSSPSQPVPTSWDSTRNLPCPFQAGKLVKDTHQLYTGINGISPHVSISLEGLLEKYPNTFSRSFFQNPMKAALTETTAHVSDSFLLYFGEIQENVATNFDDQLAILPEKYKPASTLETVLALLAFQQDYGHFPRGEFRWGWCIESLTPEKETHLAVTVAGFTRIAFDEFPNQRTRANRYIAAIRKDPF